MTRRAAIVALLCALGGLPGGGAAATGESESPRLKLTQIQDFLVSAMATRPNNPVLYVTELKGWVDAITIGEEFASRVLDLRPVTGKGTGAERGLFGLVFSPDGSKIYVLYNSNHNVIKVEEYAFANGVADPESRRALLAIPAAQGEHNGGQLAFGADGMLYIAIGDGGGEYDDGRGHKRGGNGQSLDTLLGKILRIDPTPSPGAKEYTIPQDNPFANGGGRPEIWSFGLRNPWRFSFDSMTNDLWISDVGAHDWDEIDFAPAADGAGKGVNFGWNVFEGPDRRRRAEPTGGAAQAPIATLSLRKGNCALIGGYVYRGSKIPELQGAYVYGDFCTRKIHWLRQVGGEVVAKGVLNIRMRDLVSFGRDNDGELYVLSLAKGLLRIDPAQGGS